MRGVAISEGRVIQRRAALNIMLLPCFTRCCTCQLWCFGRGTVKPAGRPPTSPLQAPYLTPTGPLPHPYRPPTSPLQASYLTPTGPLPHPYRPPTSPLQAPYLTPSLTD